MFVVDGYARIVAGEASQLDVVFVKLTKLGSPIGKLLVVNVPMRKVPSREA